MRSNTFPYDNSMQGAPVAGGDSAGGIAGKEWIVDALGCSAERLRDHGRLAGLMDRIIADLGLHVVGEGIWHRFPHPGGLTGLYLLTESHLACHTYPEFGLATFNLYCCRPRVEWPWREHLVEALSATDATVRSVDRGMGMGVGVRVGP